MSVPREPGRPHGPTEPLVPNPCSVCGEYIREGGFVGTGDGTMRDGGSFAHLECYPYRRVAVPPPGGPSPLVAKLERVAVVLDEKRAAGGAVILSARLAREIQGFAEDAAAALRGAPPPSEPQCEYCGRGFPERIANDGSSEPPRGELVEAARRVVALYFGQHARSPGIPRPTVFDAMGDLRAELARLDGGTPQQEEEEGETR